MATTLETQPATATLSNEEILRYSRHLIMPEVGMEGQLKLKAARVLCIGTGGLGSPLALYLAAAGVGTLGLVDFDVVRIAEVVPRDDVTVTLALIQSDPVQRIALLDSVVAVAVGRLRGWLGGFAGLGACRAVEHRRTVVRGAAGGEHGCA